MKKRSIILMSIIFALMLVAGTVAIISQEQLDTTITCNSDGITKEYEKISDTSKTVYWSGSDGFLHQKVCEGTWISTKTYAEEHKLSLEDITIDTTSESFVDEYGNKIILQDSFVVDKDTKTLNIEGKIYTIDYKPLIKCICDKEKGCSVNECL